MRLDIVFKPAFSVKWVFIVAGKNWLLQDEFD